MSGRLRNRRATPAAKSPSNPTPAAKTVHSCLPIRDRCLRQSVRRAAALFVVFALVGIRPALANSSEACPSTAASESLKTTLGVVTVERETDEPWNPRLLALNARTIYASDLPYLYLSLCKAYDLQRGVAVLFRSNPGGLNIDHYYLLLLGKSTHPTVVTAADFDSLTSEIEVNPSNGGLQIDLGYEKLARKTATLRDGKLTIRSEKPSRVVSLKAGVCSGLQELIAKCVDLGARHLGCDAFVGEHYEFGLPAGDALWITGLKEHPGFGSQAFGEACRRACETSEMPSRSVFKQSVCSAPYDVNTK